MKSIYIRLRNLSFIGLLFLQTNQVFSQKKNTSKQSSYACLPCGQDCDKDTYSEQGVCSHCHMKLVNRSTITFATIQPDEICSYIQKHPGVVLLDCRTKEEFEGRADPDFGTLQNAINIPIQEIESRLGSINSLKKKRIIVFCSHSHRSPQVAYLLTQNGFKKVLNMAGGMHIMTDNNCKKK